LPIIRSNSDRNVPTRCLDMTFGSGGHSSLILDHGKQPLLNCIKGKYLKIRTLRKFNSVNGTVQIRFLCKKDHILSYRGCQFESVIFKIIEISLKRVNRVTRLHKVAQRNDNILGYFLLSKFIKFLHNKQFQNMVCCRYFKVSNVV